MKPRTYRIVEHVTYNRHEFVPQYRGWFGRWRNLVSWRLVTESIYDARFQIRRDHEARTFRNVVVIHPCDRNGGTL